MSEIDRIEQEAHHFAPTSNPPVHKVEIKLTDFEWLLSRARDEDMLARRVRELEDRYRTKMSQWLSVCDSRDRFEIKSYRYEEALRFYADKNNYEPLRKEDGDRSDAFNLVDLDQGETAAEALNFECWEDKLF